MLNQISPQTFRELVSETVRVAVPWHRIDEWTIELETMLTRADLASTHLVWYRRKSRKPALWHGDIFHPDPADPPIPIRIEEVERFLPLMNGEDDHRRDSIERLTSNYREHIYPQTLIVPAAKAPDGRRIVLDGCHRLSAIWLADVPFTVALLTITGDPDELHLVDLQRLAEAPAGR